MSLNRNKTHIRENNPEIVDNDNIPINPNPNDSADRFTNKKPNIMRVDNEETSERAKRYTDEQSEEDDYNMPTTYKEYRDQLDEEENIRYNDYISNLESYVYDSENQMKTLKRHLIENSLLTT